MGDARALSFSSGTNQPKIIINSFRDISVPVTVGLGVDPLFTVETGASRLPLPPRLLVEYNDVLTQAAGDGSRILQALGVDIFFQSYYDNSNNLVIESHSNEGSPIAVKIHYRIYRDGRPS